jgi:hypothetical protein
METRGTLDAIFGQYEALYKRGVHSLTALTPRPLGRSLPVGQQL